jgi:hypothetical protein
VRLRRRRLSYWKNTKNHHGGHATIALLENIIIHGSIYAVIVNLYLFAIMMTLSPRIWAYADYPKSITDTVAPQTSREKKIGGVIIIPFFILVLGLPVLSTIILETSSGGVITLLDAFLNLYCILLIGNIAEVLLLDLLIVGTITPDFVVIPGTEGLRDTEYKAFRLHHAKAHIRAIVAMAILSLVLAGIIVMI